MEWDFIIRLCVAGLCGTVIGLDREYRVKDAGFRTHFLVALGSALIMIVSQYGFADILMHTGVGLDPSRIAAQVVSGIGFIGAGTIIIHRQLVRGLTTAASLWSRHSAAPTASSTGPPWSSVPRGIRMKTAMSTCCVRIPTLPSNGSYEPVVQQAEAQRQGDSDHGVRYPPPGRPCGDDRVAGQVAGRVVANPHLKEYQQFECGDVPQHDRHGVSSRIVQHTCQRVAVCREAACSSDEHVASCAHQHDEEHRVAEKSPAEVDAAACGCRREQDD